MNWAAIYKWIMSNQVTFDWVYGIAALFLAVFVFVEFVRGRLLSPRLVPGQHLRARTVAEDCVLSDSMPGGSLSLAELRLKDTPAQVL